MILYILFQMVGWFIVSLPYTLIIYCLLYRKTNFIFKYKKTFIAFFIVDLILIFEGFAIINGLENISYLPLYTLSLFLSWICRMIWFSHIVFLEYSNKYSDFFVWKNSNVV